MRLVIAVMLMLMGANAAWAGPPGPPPGWTLDVSKDPITDEVRVVTQTASPGAQLVLTCASRDPDRLSLIVLTDVFLGQSGPGRNDNAEYRFDADTMIKSTWAYADTSAAPTGESSALVRVLLLSEKFAVRLYDFRGLAHTYIFNVQNGQRAATLIRDMCAVAAKGL